MFTCRPLIVVAALAYEPGSRRPDSCKACTPAPGPGRTLVFLKAHHSTVSPSPECLHDSGGFERIRGHYREREWPRN